MNQALLHAVTTELPYYQPQGNEMEIFEQAFKNRLPLLIKGPTGCGKTRFVSHMAARLKLPLFTVACHDDLTAADLVGAPSDRRRRHGMERRPPDSGGAPGRHLLSG